jgi:hypothetical protein
MVTELVLWVKVAGAREREEFKDGEALGAISAGFVSAAFQCLSGTDSDSRFNAWTDIPSHC